MRMLTRGRLVPRQPRAIKRTTPTALHHEGIYNGIYIHWNTGIKPTALHHERIHNVKHIHRIIIITYTMLWVENIHNGKYNHWNMA